MATKKDPASDKQPASKEKPAGMSWEDFAELKIREAQDAGEFASNAGFGRPIPDLDEPHDDQWWIREKLRREGISVLPPSLAIKRDVELTLERISDMIVENDVRREIRRLNDRIREANLTSVFGPASTQMPLDEETVVARWRSALGRSGGAGSPAK